MLYVILMFLPIVVGAIGGGYITDETASKRTLGFVLVAIATAGVILQIAWQIVDPTYYLS
ncbi:MAG: hypothetical protein LBC35_08315 [Coriobacteriales bacterium]|jgi:uncharacterized membrane protein YoaK (UPF0700 family)|nr:hypothetical protein [Coriobacteriales bacterium]